jgi:hypothetical protein
MKSGRVVAGVCAALVLDVPNQALQHVGGFDVRAIIDRMHLDAELVLSLVVRYRVQKRGQFVDRDARTALDCALLRSFCGPVIARQLLKIVSRLLEIVRLERQAAGVPSVGLGDDVVVGFTLFCHVASVFDLRLLRFAEHDHGWLILDAFKTVRRVPSLKARRVGIVCAFWHQEQSISGNVSICAEFAHQRISEASLCGCSSGT